LKEILPVKQFWAALLVPLIGISGGLPVQGIRGARPSDNELAGISERGRALAAYDQAVWHATDAVQMANPKTAQGQHSFARFANQRWKVVFGFLSADKTKFLISYEATQGDKPQAFSVQREEPPLEDTGFYLFAARALELALADFGRPARAYNDAVLPAPGDQLYVYFYPAPLKAGSYPLGGDVRYLVAADGGKILEKRQLHKAIVEDGGAKGKKATGSHTHVTGEEPEDTDVLHVLQRSPAVAETVVTAHFVYEIEADGAIRIKKEKKN